jgi:hypothetical protein
VECQVSTVFPRPQTYWCHDRPVEVEALGERKSLRAYRSLLKSIPKHPPQDQYLVCRI